jgi:hypothetical protein
MLRPKILIPLAAVVMAALGGGAYAATQSGGDEDHEQAVLNDAAHRLNVSPSQLAAAFKAAMIDQIDAAVKAGKLTRAQANYLTQRIQQAPGIPPGGLGFRHRGLHGPGFLGAGAASYLGLSRDKLDQQLESGKSLAQIADAQHKSVSGLEQAISADAKSKLDKAVAVGQITKTEEQQRLDQLTQMLPRIVNGTPPPGPPGPPGLRGLRGGAGDEPPSGPDGGPPLPPAA